MTILRKLQKIIPFSSNRYWNKRYKNGGNSGIGSYGKIAEYKATIVNNIINKYNIRRLLDFGCGDGNQLKYIKADQYLGIDISSKAIELCIENYAIDNTKSFLLYEPNNSKNQRKIREYNADLCLSLDILLHLVEENVYRDYMRDLLTFSNKNCIIFIT